MVNHHEMTTTLVIEHNKQVERSVITDRLARLARRARRARDERAQASS